MWPILSDTLVLLLMLLVVFISYQWGLCRGRQDVTNRRLAALVVRLATQNRITRLSEEAGPKGPGLRAAGIHALRHADTRFNLDPPEASSSDQANGEEAEEDEPQGICVKGRLG